MIELTDFSKNNFEKVKSIIKDMGKSKLIFQSEAQFQHVLAMRLEKEIAENEDLKIYLEAYTNDYPNDGKKKKEDDSDQNEDKKAKRCYTDIVILDNKNMQYIAIELKYKTQKFNYTLNKFEFDLKYHGAPDIACYDYLWDLSRIEDLIEKSDGNMKNYKCLSGCAILISNDPNLWEYNKKNCTENKSPRYKMFFIKDGKNIERTDLEWIKNEENNKEKKDKDLRHNTPISLQKVKESKFEWQDYCEFDTEQKNNIFKYLFLTV